MALFWFWCTQFGFETQTKLSYRIYHNLTLPNQWSLCRFAFIFKVEKKQNNNWHKWRIHVLDLKCIATLNHLISICREKKLNDLHAFCIQYFSLKITHKLLLNQQTKKQLGKKPDTFFLYRTKKNTQNKRRN